MILPNTQAMMPGQWTAVLASLVSATSLVPWPPDPGVSLWPSSHLSGSITDNYTSGEKQSQASKIPWSSLQRNDRFWTSKPKREKQDAPNHRGTGVTPVSTAILIAADKTTFCTAHTSLRAECLRRHIGHPAESGRLGSAVYPSPEATLLADWWWDSDHLKSTHTALFYQLLATYKHQVTEAWESSLRVSESWWEMDWSKLYWYNLLCCYTGGN